MERRNKEEAKTLKINDLRNKKAGHTFQMGNQTISQAINNASTQVKNVLDRLMGNNSFNTIPLIVLAVAWFITGDIYIIAFSAIAALGPSARADAALLPLITSIVLRKSNRTISRAALAIAAACYVGIMPTLALDQGSWHGEEERTALE